MSRLLKKVRRDLLRDKRRAILSLLAILIGTMTFGISAFPNQIIPREIASVYDAVVPASASVTVDKVDENLIELTNNFDRIQTFEPRAFYTLRTQVGENQWKPLELYSAEDFGTLKINKITSEKGSFQPRVNEILLERDAVKVAKTDNITFPERANHTPINTVNELKLTPSAEYFEYDGGGYAIDGLTAPLFGTVSGSVIQNVNITNANIEAEVYKNYGVIREFMSFMTAALLSLNILLIWISPN